MDYDEVNTSDDGDTRTEISWNSFFRQLLVCSVVWVNFFVYGMCIGGPTVYIPQLRREANSTDAVSEEMASWLTSIYGFGGIPWVIVLPIAAAYYGRKLPHILICINAFAAFIFFYLSTDVTQIFISQVMESILGASITTISILVLTEYTSPQYRGIFLTFKSATSFWGIWVSNAIGTFFHWKNIGLVKMVLSIYPLVAVLFWPESPYWLASKGRLDKCAEAHRWLKGRDDCSERELKKILEMQKEKSPSWSSKNIFTKEFIKPTLLCFCIFGLYTFSGKLTCGFYSLDIIKKMTSSGSTAYTGMLLLDGLSVLGMYIGTILSKCFKRRYLFLGSSSIGISAMCALGFHTLFIHLSIVSENVYISLGLLSVYSIGVSCGPMIFCTSLYGELLPLKFRSLAMCICAIYDKLLTGTVVKLAPLVSKHLGLHAVFFFFGLTSTISLVILFKFMPETKDKTLVDIAQEIKGDDTSEKESRQKRQENLMSDVEIQSIQ